MARCSCTRRASALPPSSLATLGPAPTGSAQIGNVLFFPAQPRAKRTEQLGAGHDLAWTAAGSDGRIGAGESLRAAAVAPIRRVALGLSRHLVPRHRRQQTHQLPRLGELVFSQPGKDEERNTPTAE